MQWELNEKKYKLRRSKKPSKWANLMKRIFFKIVKLSTGWSKMAENQCGSIELNEEQREMIFFIYHKVWKFSYLQYCWKWAILVLDCPLWAFFRSSQVLLFFFEPPLHHQFWSDIQNLCDMHTSWPRGFHRMLWMVPRFIRLGGVTPPKYMELFFWDEGSIFQLVRK